MFNPYGMWYSVIMGTEVFPLLWLGLKIAAAAIAVWGVLALVAWWQAYRTVHTDAAQASEVREHITRSIVVIVAGIALYLLLSVLPVVFQLLF